MKTPFVTRGGGAPVGLSESEHVHWGMSIDHPMQRSDDTLDTDLGEALEFECDNSPEVFDEYRNGKIDELLWQMAHLESERLSWMDKVHDELKPVVSVLHPPLMRWCMSQTNLDDVDLITDVLTGFPVVGEMTQSHYQSIEEPRQKVVMSEDEIISACLQNNMGSLAKSRSPRRPMKC